MGAGGLTPCRQAPRQRISHAAMSEFIEKGMKPLVSQWFPYRILTKCKLS